MIHVLRYRLKDSYCVFYAIILCRFGVVRVTAATTPRVPGDVAETSPSAGPTFAALVLARHFAKIILIRFYCSMAQRPNVKKKVISKNIYNGLMIHIHNVQVKFVFSEVPPTYSA